MVRARGEPKITAMAKADPRETPGRPGPVRTSSGTRVAARRASLEVLETVESEVAAQRSANDVNEMPTRELDLEQLRAMALRCASDVGSAERSHPASPIPGAEEPRPRLELVLAGDAPLFPRDADGPEGAVRHSRRSGVLALVVVVVVLAVASVAACEVYGLLP